MKPVLRKQLMCRLELPSVAVARNLGDYNLKNQFCAEFIVLALTKQPPQELSRPKKWKGEKVPLLSEVLASMPQGKGIFIEIKCGPEIVQKLSEVIAQSKIPRKLITIISFNKEVVRAIKKHDPKLTVNWLSDLKPKKGEDISSKLAKAIQTLKDIKADGLGAKAVDSLAAKLGSTLKQHGLGFHVWTVDAPA